MPEVLEAKKESSGIIEDYKNIKDKSQNRFNQMETLFKYFINNAKLATEEINNIEVLLYLDKTQPTEEIVEDNYIIGPYKINKDTDLPYALNVKITDRNGNDLTNKYTLLDENKTDITDKTIEDLVGQTFYLKIPVQAITENSIDGIKFKIEGRYNTTKVTYWTSSKESDVQPVVEIEKEPQIFSDENEVIFKLEEQNSL